jgi:hypothetical protein
LGWLCDCRFFSYFPQFININSSKNIWQPYAILSPKSWTNIRPSPNLCGKSKRSHRSLNMSPIGNISQFKWEECVR